MFHTIIVAGNLGRDPEMRYTPNGDAVTTLSVAVDDSYTNNQGERIKKTIWTRVSVWGKQAENANEYLRKGSKVLVEGKLVCDPESGNPRVFERQDGTFGSSYEVRAFTVRYLSSRRETEGGFQDGSFTPDSKPTETDEEIPF